uniref:Uncharacterized protein n=1 Tax=Periophthalmus magnuspinnatus TaxID=409849 RepID=A0A3B4BIR0_9GOBI
MTSVPYLKYRGILLPPEAHTKKSLEFAENFTVEDTDVFTVTFPKSVLHMRFVYSFINRLTSPRRIPLSRLSQQR